MEEELRAYITIPTFILKSRDLTYTEMILFGIITNLANDSGYCSVDNKFLSNLLNLSETRISHLLSNLKATGNSKKKYSLENCI